MKLILNGGGSGNQVADARRLLNELIDHDKKILYIPFAWPDQTYSFIQRSFEQGRVETNGTEVSAILPPMSMFTPTNDRQEK